MRVALIAMLITASTAFANTLVLDHATLERTAAKARTTVTYETGVVVLRTRVKYAWVWWPVRVEAVFVREDGHIRLKATKLVVSGKSMPSRLKEADARVAKLVDVASDADIVEVYQGSEVVYSQVLNAGEPGK